MKTGEGRPRFEVRYEVACGVVGRRRRVGRPLFGVACVGDSEAEGRAERGYVGACRSEWKGGGEVDT